MVRIFSRTCLLSLSAIAFMPLASVAFGKAPAKEAAADLKEGVVFGSAELAPKSGSKSSGTVSFKRTKNGIEVTAQVKDVKPGVHGFHIHEKGDCSAADAASAGGHFNPTGAPHADPASATRHVGDLGNITIDKDGSGKLDLKVTDIKAFKSWKEIIGKAVILHEGSDDLKSQPAGNAGPRIACGTIAAPETT